MAQTPIPGSNPLRPVDGAQAQPGSASSKGKATDATSTESPAFRILLEKLQSQARELEEKSNTLEAPEHLAEAVDIARASLDDALSLSDQLLESFRSAQQATPDEEERS
jgi:hypothetical protein